MDGYDNNIFGFGVIGEESEVSCGRLVIVLIFCVRCFKVGVVCIFSCMFLEY